MLKVGGNPNKRTGVETDSEESKSHSSNDNNIKVPREKRHLSLDPTNIPQKKSLQKIPAEKSGLGEKVRDALEKSNAVELLIQFVSIPGNETFLKSLNPLPVNQKRAVYEYILHTLRDGGKLELNQQKVDFIKQKNPARTLHTVLLLEVGENKDMLAALQKYCQEQQVSENLNFFLDFADFQKNPSLEQAQTIYDKYIKAAGQQMVSFDSFELNQDIPESINIPDDVLKSAKKAFGPNASSTALDLGLISDVLTKIQLHIMHVIESAFSGFLEQGEQIEIKKQMTEKKTELDQADQSYINNFQQSIRVAQSLADEYEGLLSQANSFQDLINGGTTLDLKSMNLTSEYCEAVEIVQIPLGKYTGLKLERMKNLNLQLRQSCAQKLSDQGQKFSADVLKMMGLRSTMHFGNGNPRKIIEPLEVGSEDQLSSSNSSDHFSTTSSNSVKQEKSSKFKLSFSALSSTFSALSPRKEKTENKPEKEKEKS